MFDYYEHVDENCHHAYIYDQSKNEYIDYDIKKTPSGYLCDVHKGKPSNATLIKKDIVNIWDIFEISYERIRTDHDDYWWDYGVCTYVTCPNDDRIRIKILPDGKSVVKYLNFHPRYRVYKHRGDFYIWCCDEGVIRRVHCDNGKLYIDDEFEASDIYWGCLETDWDFQAEFNTWEDCFMKHIIRFKTPKEMFL